MREAFLWVISWFESHKTPRDGTGYRVSLSISLLKCFCRSTFRYFPLPSTACLKVDCSAEQMLLRFCQQFLSAQPPHRQLDNGFRKVGWWWQWGCALISLFASFVPEMVVHCHSQPETYLCLIWDKGMGFSYLLFKDTHIQKPGKAAVYTKMPSTGKLHVRGLDHKDSSLASSGGGALRGTWLESTCQKTVYFHDFPGEGVSGFPSYMRK